MKGAVQEHNTNNNNNNGSSINNNNKKLNRFTRCLRRLLYIDDARDVSPRFPRGLAETHQRRPCVAHHRPADDATEHKGKNRKNRNK